MAGRSAEDAKAEGVQAEGGQRLSTLMDRLSGAVFESSPRVARGRVRHLQGVIIEATVKNVRIGEICELVEPGSSLKVKAEVVGLRDGLAVLTPLGDLAGLSSAAEVVPTGQSLRIRVGWGLLGRVLNPFGEPLDNKPWPPRDAATFCDVGASPPQPLERARIDRPLSLGIRALDGLLTCGRGQRIGIFGEPGVGKSSLLANIARGTNADVAVIGLIGERGREVREFIEHQLGPEGCAKAVIVVATSDRPAMERVKATYTATAIAEYFRDCGAHVLLMIDSMTRFARAQREIGLAAGEPPTRRGFPPSLFALLPRILERSGPGVKGSITGIYTVLVEGEVAADPLAEEVQAILDGHVILSSELAQRDHFPAIDVLRSRSRLMTLVTSRPHQADASRLRELLSRYADVELLIRVGEYRSGSDPDADEAIAKIDEINGFLRQANGEHESMEGTLAKMRALVL
jgi:ATP synthase in type III secretion protein N